jgi:hypothetical protein
MSAISPRLLGRPNHHGLLIVPTQQPLPDQMFAFASQETVQACVGAIHEIEDHMKGLMW